MQIELANCTQTILEEIGNDDLTKMDVAQTYTLAMRSTESTNWGIVNRAIITRWGEEALEEIKALGWSGLAFKPDHCPYEACRQADCEIYGDRWTYCEPGDIK
jgi:hypothetical protein